MAQGNVLVVEDDEQFRRLLVEYLRESSCPNVDGARDGVEALHHISTRPYDVVVLDVMMPHMSGIDVLTSLDALTSDPSVKPLRKQPAVIIITSASQEALPADDLQRRFPTFVHGVLRKPLHVPDLAASINALLR